MTLDELTMGITINEQDERFLRNALHGKTEEIIELILNNVTEHNRCLGKYPSGWSDLASDIEEYTHNKTPPKLRDLLHNKFKYGFIEDKEQWGEAINQLGSNDSPKKNDLDINALVNDIASAKPVGY